MKREDGLYYLVLVEGIRWKRVEKKEGWGFGEGEGKGTGGRTEPPLFPQPNTDLAFLFFFLASNGRFGRESCEGAFFTPVFVIWLN